LVREEFGEIKIEQRHKMEALEKQIFRDVTDYKLIRYYRSQSFAATDTEHLCADRFHMRCSKCKHPGDFTADRYGLADAEEKALE